MSDLISRFVEEGMMWEAPIKVMQKEVKMQMEGEILKAVREVGIVVDKEELMKALRYDREQYERGYVDGFNANKWIPVEERLPEPNKAVLVSTNTGEVDVDYYGTHCRDFIGLKGTHMKPIAWMPLPEAYKEK